VIASAALAVLAIVASVTPLAAQSAPDPTPPRVESLFVTPFGALPPIAPLMPANRDNHFWGVRLQYAHRARDRARAAGAVALGIDLQWRGGSVVGVTAGYRRPDCAADPAAEPAVAAFCDDHPILAVGGRFNFLTGGSGVVALFSDPSATNTLGLEIQLGVSPGIAESVTACSFGLGIPYSVSFGRTLRLVPFLTPQVGWSIGCSDAVSTSGTRGAISAGIGVQQILVRGLDAYLGYQRIFRSDAGHLIGLTISYVFLR